MAKYNETRFICVPLKQYPAKSPHEEAPMKRKAALQIFEEQPDRGRDCGGCGEPRSAAFITGRRRFRSAKIRNKFPVARNPDGLREGTKRPDAGLKIVRNPEAGRGDDTKSFARPSQIPGLVPGFLLLGMQCVLELPLAHL